MDNSGSEWISSGCESGWTVYLDESSLSPNNSHSKVADYQRYRYEEDLSMVSDASSGPPHFQYGGEEEEEVQPSSSSSEKLKKKKKKKNSKIKEARTQTHQHSFLDDTASSPAFAYSNVNMSMDPSNTQHHLYGYPQENGFMGSSAYGNQYGLWQPSHTTQQDSTQSSRSRGRRRG